MTDEIASFLATSPVFGEVPSDQIVEIAPLFREERYPAGSVILRQGGHSSAIYFVRSGRLAVRIQRGEHRETVAYLQPPALFGELSFITGRTCSADVEVIVDADVVLLSKEVLAHLPRQREAILSGLMNALAARLHDTVTGGGKAAESPVILLRNHPCWEAPASFAAELACSLARQTERQTLLVNLDASGEGEIRSLAGVGNVCDLAARPAAGNLRADIAQRLTAWKGRFDNVVLNPTGPDAPAVAAAIGEFANWQGDLAGPGDEVPPDGGDRTFAVESAARPTLPVLSGRRQLISEAAESEEAWRKGGPVTPRFRRTVDSIARAIGGLQVGLALGGGAAWGWAHIGVLATLEQADIPVDVISGCSMGSVIGAFRGSGMSVAELREIAEYWRTRTRRFLEWRFWRMSLISERAVRKTFRQYFGERAVNQTEIPYWANAVDVQTGKEYTIQSGTLVDCVRASIALPGLLPPFPAGPHLLVDAGVTDPVPVNLVHRMGCHFAIAVNAMAALEATRVKTRYPFNAFDVMTRCMFIMGHEIGQARAEQAANVVFTPSLGSITMLQFDRSPEIIDCGRKAAEENLPAIQAGYARLKKQRQPAQ